MRLRFVAGVAGAVACVVSSIGLAIIGAIDGQSEWKTLLFMFYAAAQVFDLHILLLTEKGKPFRGVHMPTMTWWKAVGFYVIAAFMGAVIGWDRGWIPDGTMNFIGFPLLILMATWFGLRVREYRNTPKTLFTSKEVRDQWKQNPWQF